MKEELLTVLPDIHTDGVRRCNVGVWRPHGSTGIPHVKKEENWDRREAEDGEEGQSKDVSQEHELKSREVRTKKKFRLCFSLNCIKKIG